MAAEPSPEDPQQVSSSDRRLPAPALIGVLLVIMAWLGLLVSGPGAYQRQSVEWPNESGQTLRGDLWLPAKSTPDAQTYPGIVLVHGVMSSRLQPETAARALAAAGFVVLNLDLRGYGESDSGPDTPDSHRDDVLSALGFIRAQPDVKAQQIALVGHSMGATAVVEAAAADNHVQAVYALGMHGDGTANWLTGLYDNLHPPGLYTPRQRVWSSPSANHQTEWVDLSLLNHLRQDLEQRFIRPVGQSVLPVLIQTWSKLLLGLGFVFVLGSLLRLYAQAYLRLGISTVGLAALLACGYFSWLEPGLCANSALVLLGAYICSGISERVLRQLGILLLLLVVARELASVLRSLPWQSFKSLLSLPVYLWQSLMYYPAALGMGLRQLLFATSQIRLEPAWPLIALLAAEWLFPMWWLKISAQLSLPAKRTRPALLALGFGCVMLAVLIWTRLQQGYLEAEGIQTLGRVVLGEVPTGMFFLAGLWWLQRNHKGLKSQPEQLGD